MFRVFLLLSLCFLVRSDRVYTKNCDGSDTSICQVTSADVENCSHAPRFCRVSNDKQYFTTVTFVPHFTADKMMMTTSVDLKSEKYVSLKKRLCEDHLLICPLEPGVKQTLQFDFTLNKSLNGRYPAQLKFWNAANETEACCFTFRIKTL